MKATFVGKDITLIGHQMKVGDKLPEFTLTATDFSNVSSQEDIKLPAVFLVLLSVDTGVCSLELLTFNDRLDGTNYNVYAVSTDMPFTLDRWVKTNAGDFITMLSDYKAREFGHATGTLIDELKFLARATFIFDKNGICQFAEYLPEIATEPDYDKIMEEAKKYFD